MHICYALVFHIAVLYTTLGEASRLGNLVPFNLRRGEKDYISTIQIVAI